MTLEINIRTPPPTHNGIFVEAEICIDALNVTVTMTTDQAKQMAWELTNAANKADAAWEEREDARQRQRDVTRLGFGWVA